MSAPDVRGLAQVIRAAQYPSGLIGWYPGGHGDPWNHVEAAMALDLAGERESALAAYEWLACRQRPDGSLFAYYAPDGLPEEQRVDTNAASYLACGI